MNIERARSLAQRHRKCYDWWAGAAEAVPALTGRLVS